MNYQPMPAKEYTTGRELVEDYNAVHRKFFDRSVNEIKMRCIEDQGVIAALHGRVARQLSEMNELVAQTRDYQAKIEALRIVLSERHRDLLRVEGRISKIESAAAKSSAGIVDCQTVMAAVAHAYGITTQIIKGQTRDKRAVAARRHVIHILTTTRPDLSLPLIGRLLGGRDHTTIMHARNTWWRYADKYKQQFDMVNQMIGIRHPVDNEDNPQQVQQDNPCDDKITDCG